MRLPEGSFVPSIESQHSNTTVGWLSKRLGDAPDKQHFCIHSLSVLTVVPYRIVVRNTPAALLHWFQIGWEIERTRRIYWYQNKMRICRSCHHHHHRSIAISVLLVVTSMVAVPCLRSTVRIASSYSLNNPNNIVNRAKFLSASAATFLTSTTAIVMTTAASPEECQAAEEAGIGGGGGGISGNHFLVSRGAKQSDQFSKNPRYIEKELQMEYGEDKNGNPRTRGMFVRRLTGDSTPYKFPVKPIRLVKEWPEGDPPFKAEDFFRADEGNDSSFYTVPRLVYHIDEPAVASLTQYYRNNIPKGSKILGPY